MSRSIDHLVLPVHDLAAAATCYRRLGFSVSPRNRHPFGTQNHIIQLDSSYLELIGLAPDFQRSPSPPGAYSFAGFVAAWLRQRQGLAMLALASRDAALDAGAFKAAGIGDFAPLHFERDAKAADGSEARLGFTLAFARSPLIEAAGWFTCQHHSPADFWRADLQQHANSARRLIGATLIAENPSAHAEFLGAFLDQRMMLATSMGVEIAIGSAGAPQTIEVLTPAAARFRFGNGFDATDPTTRFIAYRVAVDDPDATRKCLREAAIPFAERAGALIVAAKESFGVTIAFEMG